MCAAINSQMANGEPGRKCVYIVAAKECIILAAATASENIVVFTALFAELNYWLKKELTIPKLCISGGGGGGGGR